MSKSTISPAPLPPLKLRLPVQLQLRFLLAVLLPTAVRQSPLPADCSDVYAAGSGLSGVYAIYPAGPTSGVQVYCDMSEDRLDNSPEKWTVSRSRGRKRQY